MRFRGKANQQVWFHFAIPTPVINSGDRVFLDRVFVLWKTTGGAQLLRVHVRDGAREPTLYQNNEINLAGTFDGSPDQPGDDPISKSQLEGQNRFTLSPAQTVFYGIGISALIGFDSHSDDSEVSFASAGADFSTP